MVESIQMQESEEGRKPVLLVLCRHNAARSQMTEAFLRRYLGEHFTIESAGLNPTEVHPLAIRVMEEMGFSLSGHHAKPLRQFLGRLPVRVAIAVCRAEELDCPTVWPGALAVLSWPFDDPAAATGTEEQQLARFRASRDLIHAQVRAWAGRVASGAIG